MFHGLHEYIMQRINLLTWIFRGSGMTANGHQGKQANQTGQKSSPHVTNTRLSQGT